MTHEISCIVSPILFLATHYFYILRVSICLVPIDGCRELRKKEKDGVMATPLVSWCQKELTRLLKFDTSEDIVR